LERRRDAAGDARDLVAADHLQPGGSELLPFPHVQQLVGERHDVVAPCHVSTDPRARWRLYVTRRGHLADDRGGTVGSPASVGVPRFELGASPTRTERATRLRHTPSVHRVAGAYPRSVLKAVLFDVDFTLFQPGPELGPEGYRRLGERHGLRLDPDRYDEARFRAVEVVQQHPELVHDEEIWIAFTQQIMIGMGGEPGGCRDCAVDMVREWERHEN